MSKEWVDAPVEIVRAFKAGIALALDHPNHSWTEEEWRAALRECVPQEPDDGISYQCADPADPKTW